MSGRAAIVTQADIARSIRAMIAEGLKIVRVVARADGVAIETADCPIDDVAAEPKKPIEL